MPKINVLSNIWHCESLLIVTSCNIHKPLLIAAISSCYIHVESIRLGYMYTCCDLHTVKSEQKLSINLSGVLVNVALTENFYIHVFTCFVKGIICGNYPKKGLKFI